jgi:putative membrane protein
MVVLDEESSAFLVNAANNSMTELQLGELAQQKTVSQKIKSFSSMLIHDHSVLKDQVKILAAQMNVILPDTIGNNEQKQIDGLMQKRGAGFDKNFMETVIKSYEEAIGLYEKALLNRKDPDINSFADKTLMTLHMHLDSAKSIRSVIK